jgi:hypothetical protein
MKVSPVEEAKEAKEKEAQVVNEEAVGEIWEVTVEAMGAVLVEGKDAVGSAEEGKEGGKEVGWVEVKEMAVERGEEEVEKD